MELPSWHRYLTPLAEHPLRSTAGEHMRNPGTPSEGKLSDQGSAPRDEVMPPAEVKAEDSTRHQAWEEPIPNAEPECSGDLLPRCLAGPTLTHKEPPFHTTAA